MDILRDYRNCPERLQGAVLAIGNFDGVHRGHQAVLGAAIEAAQAQGRRAGAMAFEPHPRQFFQPDKPLFRLSPLPIKLKLFESLGLDLVVVLDFDAALAGLTAEDFARRVLVDGLGIGHAVIGYDFHFGKGRGGNPDVLRALGTEFDFGVTVVGPVEEGGEAFSSSRVRAHLRNGEPEAAATLLGYWWRLRGPVVGGAKRGHGLGFPTANIDLPEGVELKHGIYAVAVWIDGRRHRAAAYLGTRPTFDSGAPQMEVFVFDFGGDLYGQEIELEVIAYLRGDEAFATPEALTAQMREDCVRAQALLERIDADDPMRRFPIGAALGGSQSVMTR